MTPDAIAEALIPSLEKLVAKHMAPLLERVAQLEGRELPTAEELGAEAARILLTGDGIKSLIDLEMEAYVAANPPQKGEKGDPGADGQDGAPGKDGVGMAGALIDRDGSLTVTMTNGEVKSLGPVVGKDGENGKDGLGIEDLTRTYDADTHEIVERWGQKELRYPAGGIFHGGYWREGVEAKAAQTWTHAGIAWIAKRDTVQKPDRGSDDWEIFASKGRDGKDLRDAPAREPIRVGHG